MDCHSSRDAEFDKWIELRLNAVLMRANQLTRILAVIEKRFPLCDKPATVPKPSQVVPVIAQGVKVTIGFQIENEPNENFTETQKVKIIPKIAKPKILSRPEIKALERKEDGWQELRDMVRRYEVKHGLSVVHSEIIGQEKLLRNDELQFEMEGADEVNKMENIFDGCRGEDIANKMSNDNGRQSQSIYLGLEPDASKMMYEKAMNYSNCYDDEYLCLKNGPKQKTHKHNFWGQIMKTCRRFFSIKRTVIF